MEHQLGAKLSEKARLEFLQANCDATEEIGYMKAFTAEEIAAFKDQLAEVSIDINEIELEKKKVLAEYKLRLDPLTQDKGELLGRIKNKAEHTKERCFKFIDLDRMEIGFYNPEGHLIEQRPARPDERQFTIKMMPTGTGQI